MEYQTLDYKQMANIVEEIAKEVKRRNPLLVNFYVKYLNDAVRALMEFHCMETDQPEMDEDQG